MKNKSYTTQKDELDRFYTDRTVSLDLIKNSKFILDSYSMFVEPSAGDGSFIDAVSEVLQKPCLGYDLLPARNDITQQDWLKFNDSLNGTCIVGNPPFGTRSKLAKQFIQKCINLDASCIAFILPKTFSKPTLQQIFPSDWKLVYTETIKDSAFLLDSIVYHVDCVWQIWEKNSTRPSFRWEEQYDPSPTDFEIVSNQDDADWFVMGAAPHIVKNPELVSPTNRGYWISCIDKKETKRNIENINWKKYGCGGVSGGVFWITSSELLAYYKKEIYGK